MRHPLFSNWDCYTDATGVARFTQPLFLYSGSDEDFAPVEKRAPAGRRGAATKKVNYSQSSDSEGDLF